MSITQQATPPAELPRYAQKATQRALSSSLQQIAF